MGSRTSFPSRTRIFPRTPINLNRHPPAPHPPPPLPQLIDHPPTRSVQAKHQQESSRGKMDHRLPGGVPAVRLSSRLQLATTYGAAEPASLSGRSARGPPPALTADVRVVIRRHFPVVGPGGARVAGKVAADIALRRRPSRALRGAGCVERALADEVLLLVAHPFDRGAVVGARKEICARVAAACGDPRSRAPCCSVHLLASQCHRRSVPSVRRETSPPAGPQPGAWTARSWSRR